MCGRFVITKPQNIQKRYKTKNKLPLFDKSYNVAPNQTVPTITRNSPNTITMMKWGLKFSKTSKKAPINIRSETLASKAYFKRFLESRRCIVPSNGFYEWKTLNLEGKIEKHPFFIYKNDKSMLSMAGIYNILKDAENKTHYFFAILTCSPNEKIKKIHNRMPVILNDDKEDTWLNSNTTLDTLFSLLKPYSDNKLDFYHVSKYVNNPRNDSPSLIKEVKL
jgi:putative SOS response-associated peptidase YedK